MEKVLYSIFGVVIALSIAFNAYLSFSLNKCQKELRIAKEDLANRDTLIDFQNATIAKNKLDLDNYKALRPAIEKQIQYKYSTIEVRDTTCEAQIEALNKTLEAFYTRGE